MYLESMLIVDQEHKIIREVITHIRTSFFSLSREHVRELFLCLHGGGVPPPAVHLLTEGSACTERGTRGHGWLADGDGVA